MDEYYFGYTDASSEDIKKLLEIFTDVDFENDIKSNEKERGKQVIVGIKGSGKTCLRRKYEATSDAIVFNLDSDNAFLQIDASAFQEHSGRLKNLISFEILRGFSEIIANNSKAEEGFKEKISSAFNKAKDFIGKIPDAVNVDTGLGTINLRELFKAEASPIVQAAWTNLLTDILDSLDGKKTYILIDDAEDVFKGLETNPDFIEALARSVLDINKKSGKKLHILLFIKNGVWRIWFEKPREYDKVKHIIQHITWEKERLIELIARRIAEIHSEDFNRENIEELWRKEFEIDDFEKFTDFILQYCVNGPRDLIEICNLAKIAAGGNKINKNHISSKLKEYSESKFFSIFSDYTDVYPDIHIFIKRVFQGLKTSYQGLELEEILESKGLTDAKTESIFEDFSWFSSASKEQLLELMFKIGLIGIKNGDKVQYSLEKPNENISDLEENELIIHPAFRPYLGIKED